MQGHTNIKICSPLQLKVIAHKNFSRDKYRIFMEVNFQSNGVHIHQLEIFFNLNSEDNSLMEFYIVHQIFSSSSFKTSSTSAPYFEWASGRN